MKLSEDRSPAAGLYPRVFVEESCRRLEHSINHINFLGFNGPPALTVFRGNWENPKRERLIQKWSPGARMHVLILCSIC